MTAEPESPGRCPNQRGRPVARAHSTLPVVEVDNADFCEIEVGDRGTQSYGRDELIKEGWTVIFSLGV